MNRIFIIGAGLLIGTASVTAAAAPLATFEAPATVVSSTKFPISSDRALDKVRVINRHQLAADGITSLESLFDEVSNIHIFNAGGQRSLFLRGGGSHLTNLMVDGVSLRDVSSPAATPMLNNIPVSSIERIEIISNNKGSLYGSSASNGVISIYTDLQNRGNFSNINASIGDRKYSGGFTRGVVLGDSQFNFTASHSLDQSHSDFSGTSEIDQKWSSQVGASLRQSVGSANVLAQVQLFNGQDDLDFYVFFPAEKVDDPNRRIRFFENRVNIQAEYPINPTLTGKVSYLRAYAARDDRNDPDTVSTANERYENVGGTDEIEGSVHWTGVSNSNLLAGVVWNKEATTIVTYPFSGVIEPTDRVNVSQNRTGIYSSWDQQIGVFQYFLNGRHDISDSYQASTLAIGSKLYLPEQVTLSGSFSTGFNAPSLFQRFSSYGKPDLNSESSKTWDFGVSKRWYFVTLSANYFDTLVNNLIGYNFDTETYFNVAGSNRYLGLELEAAVDSVAWLRRTEISYTHLDSQSGSAKSYNVPEYKWHVGSGIGGDQWALRGNLIAVGPRLDNTTGPVLTLPPYAILNTSGTYWLSDNESVVLGVENILNTRYEWITNYNGPGRSIKVSYQLEM